MGGAGAATGGASGVAMAFRRLFSAKCDERRAVARRRAALDGAGLREREDLRGHSRLHEAGGHAAKRVRVVR